MSDLQFEDAAPVKRPFSGGRQAAPNPYTEVIAAIALKTDDQGNPVAKAFTLTHNVDPTVLGYDADQTHNEEGDSITELIVNRDRKRAERQLRAAGKDNDPTVTVRVAYEDANTSEQPAPGKSKQTVYKTRVTFWTVKPYAGKNAASE